MSTHHSHRLLSLPSHWAGVWTALVTPLKKSGTRLELDRASLEKLINQQIAGGVRGLVIGGSTGEGSSLDPDIFDLLLVSAVELVAGRVPLVAGLGIGSTAHAVRVGEKAKSHGYHGLLASPPAYVKAPQRGLKQHFMAIAEIGLPVCLYEIPGRAASSIELSTLVELWNDPTPAARNFVAIKDATANLQRALDEHRLLGDRVALLSGDDGTLAPFLAAGGVGVISVVSHLVPHSMNRIVTAAQNKDFATALHEQSRLNPLVEALFWESNPIPVKSLLARQ